jgi:hypothetical protein
LNERLNVGRLRQQYKDQFKTNCQPSAEPLLRSAARATKVVGQMLGGLSDNRQLNWAAVWITRLARVFWGLVEVAVPRSILNLLVRYWIKLLYLFEVLSIAGGVLFASPAIQNAGLKILGLTLAAHITVTLLSDRMTGRTVWRWWQWLLALVVIAVLVAAFVEINYHLRDDVSAVLNHLFGNGASAWISAHIELSTLIVLVPLALVALPVGLVKLWRFLRHPLYEEEKPS